MRHLKNVCEVVFSFSLAIISEECVANDSKEENRDKE